MRRAISITLSVLYSIFLLIGNSFMLKGNFDLIFNYPFIHLSIFILMIYLFNRIIFYLCKKIDRFQLKKGKLLTKHTFLICFVMIVICWLPYIISFYPTILSPDPSFQIMQFFNIDNKYSTYSVLLDENVIITNHHPVVHTLLLGSMVKIGTLIGSVNIGLFLYSIIQITILASTLAYTIYFMRKIEISNRYCFICLMIYAFTPVFPFYAMSAVKDVIFGSLVILYILSIYQIIVDKKVYLFKQILLMILLTLFRNNGIHVIFLSFPFLLIQKKNIKEILLIFILVICFHVTYNKVILPYFKITPASIREMLSIPFQQTARYVSEYDNEIEEDEKQIIDKILEYDTLKERYKPEISDPVKNKFNRYYKEEDLKKYFNIWFNHLKKHPLIYIEATIENSYGYFYPFKTNWYFYHDYDDRIVKKGFSYHYNSLNTIRNILTLFAKIFPYIPFLGLIVNIGLNSWILLFMTGYLFSQKNYKGIIIFIPSFILLLVCIASPVNTYFRYALPNIFSMPLLIAIFLNLTKRDKSV